MLRHLFTLYNHIIYVYLDILAQLGLEHPRIILS